MNGLDIPIVGLGRRPRTELTERFLRLGHEVTRRPRPAWGLPAPRSCDVVVVDAAAGDVSRKEIERIRSGFRRPVLVVGERPACLSGIDGAMFCFSDAGDDGHDLALRMCFALRPLVACESTARIPGLGLCGARAPLSPRRWQPRPAPGRMTARA